MTEHASTAIIDTGGEAVMCPPCRCVAAALAEVGLDPARVTCSERLAGDGGVLPPQYLCSVGLGFGTEGLSLAEVEPLVDKAIEVCAGCIR